MTQISFKALPKNMTIGELMELAKQKQNLDNSPTLLDYHKRLANKIVLNTIIGSLSEIEEQPFAEKLLEELKNETKT